MNVINLSGPPKADDGRPRMTAAEWIEEGRRRFGDDMLAWRFVCPACHHVQTAEDFRPYKDQGAEPDSVRHSCIGRFSAGRDALGGKGAGPCNYTAYGLFRLAPLVIVDPALGCEYECFAFAD